MSTIEELKRKEYHWLWGLRPTKTEEHKLWDEAISIMNDPIRLQLIIQQQNKRLLSSRFRWVDSILSGFYRMFINPIYRLFNIGNFAKNEAVLEIIRVVKEDNDKKQTPNVARVPNSLEANSDSPIISSPRAVQDLTSRSSQKASPSSIDFEPPASPKEAKNDDTILPSSNLETGTSPSHPQDASGVKSHSSQQGHSPELVREKEPSIGGSEDANEPDDNSSSPKKSISRADDTILPSSNLEPGTSPSQPQDGSGVKSHSSQQGYSPELVREKEPSIGGPEDTNEPEVNSSSPKKSISRAEDTILPSSNLETGTSPSHPQDGSGAKSYSSQQGYSPELVREKEPSIGGPEDTNEPEVNLSSPKSISRAEDTIPPSSNLEPGTSPSHPQDGSGAKSYSSQQGYSPELVREKEPSIGGPEDTNEPEVNLSSPKSISRAEDTIPPSSNLEPGTSPSHPQDGSGVKSHSSQQGYSPELVREKEPSIGGPEDTNEPEVNLSSPKSISRAEDTIPPSSNLEPGTSPSHPQDGSGVKSHSSQGYSPELVREKEPSIGGPEDTNEPEVNSSSPKKSISRAEDTILPSSNLETGTSPSHPQDGSGVKSYSSQQGYSPELVREKEPSIGGSEDANEPEVNSSSPKKSISRAEDTILPSSNLETGTSPSQPQDGSGVKSYSSQQGHSPELVREKEPSIGGPEDTSEPDVNLSSPKKSISRADDTILPSSNLEMGTSPSQPQDGSGVKSYSSQQGHSPELVREKEPSIGGSEDANEPDVNSSSPKKSISRAEDTIPRSPTLEMRTSFSQPQDASGVKSHSSQQGHSPELVREKEPSIGGPEDTNEPDVNLSSPKESISRADDDTILPSSNLEPGTSPSHPQDGSGVKIYSSQQGHSPELVLEKEPSIGGPEDTNEPDVNLSSPKESISRANDDTILPSSNLETGTSPSHPQDGSGVKSYSSQQGHSPELVLEKEPSIGEPKDTNEPVTPSRTPTPRADYDTVLRSPNIERGISPSNPRDARSVKSQSSQRRHSPVFVRENEPSIGRSKVFNEPEVNLSSPKKPTPEVAEMGTTPRPHLPKMNLALSASSKNPFEQALEMFEYTQGEFIMLTSNELTRKYRKLTPRYHPDKAKNSDRTSFQRFSDAYTLLETRLRGLHPAPALNTNQADWQEQQERVDKVNAENEKLMKDPIWEQPVDHSKVDDEVAKTEELYRKTMAALARKKQKKKSAPDNQPTDSVSPLDTHHVAPSL
jgi:hypothetical protein